MNDPKQEYLIYFYKHTVFMNNNLENSQQSLTINLATNDTLEIGKISKIHLKRNSFNEKENDCTDYRYIVIFYAL